MQWKEKKHPACKRRKKAFKEDIPDTDKQLQEKKDQKKNQKPKKKKNLRKNTSSSFSLSKTKTGRGYVQER